MDIKQDFVNLNTRINSSHKDELKPLDTGDVNNIKAFIAGNDHAISMLPEFEYIFKNGNSNEIQQLRNLLKALFVKSVTTKVLKTILHRCSIRLQHTFLKFVHSTKFSEDITSKLAELNYDFSKGYLFILESLMALQSNSISGFEIFMIIAISTFSKEYYKALPEDQLKIRIMAQNSINNALRIFNKVTIDKKYSLDTSSSIYQLLLNSPFRNILRFFPEPYEPLIGVGYTINWLDSYRKGQVNLITKIDTISGLVYVKEQQEPISVLEILHTSVRIFKES